MTGTALVAARGALHRPQQLGLWPGACPRH